MMIQFIADSTTGVTRIMFDYSIPTASNTRIIFKKSLKSIKDALACYSYHNPYIDSVK
jgi:hypothetical protein